MKPKICEFDHRWNWWASACKHYKWDFVTNYKRLAKYQRNCTKVMNKLKRSNCTSFVKKKKKKKKKKPKKPPKSCIHPTSVPEGYTKGELGGNLTLRSFAPTGWSCADGYRNYSGNPIPQKCKYFEYKKSEKGTDLFGTSRKGNKQWNGFARKTLEECEEIAKKRGKNWFAWTKFGNYCKVVKSKYNKNPNLSYSSPSHPYALYEKVDAKEYTLQGCEPKVTKCTGETIMYYDWNNKSGQNLKSTGTRELKKAGDHSFNDRLDSMIVPKGCKVILYRDVRFRGSMSEYGPGTHKNLGRNMSSFKILNDS